MKECLVVTDENNKISGSEPLDATGPKVAAARIEKTADRPHRLTLAASIAAVAISFSSLSVSWLSYRASSRTAESSLALGKSSQRLTQVIQGAVIDVSNDFLGSLDFLDKDQLGVPRQFKFSWTIANIGNTAANSVRSLRVVHLVTSSNNRELGAPNRFTVHMAPRQKQILPFYVELTADEYRLLRGGGAWLEITGQVLYDDVFGKNHELDSYFRLKGDGLTEYRQVAPLQKEP